ncbi:hypothetical protein QAD02_023497 [Eretmocerus hayati]|uniref:Uncharacterized protein n=1 Tax=Eretmocerus hayati TaxID=131215 RepID=A0ACC2PXN1_9HYME|nr:hypothetical protein QAD02_023497 [Eretmocerus hayati]
MPDTDEEDFCKKMRRATREIHAISDALVNAKLAFGFMDNKVWADGLLVFYEIFRYLEGAMLRLRNTKVGQLRVEGLQRTEAFEKDLEYYLGRGWMKNYTPRDSVARYLMRLREVEDTDSLLLMAYIYHLYMGLLSGGIILRKKRQLIQKMSPFKDKVTNNDGNNLTDFGEFNIYELKSELRSSMNRIAETLDEDTKNRLLEESKTVYILNNEIIQSVQGAGNVIMKKLVYLLLILIFITIVFLQLFRQ